MSVVSVVIPSFNTERYIREAISSAVSQGHPDLEVIVVDDGSTDATADIAESFGPPVRVFRQTNQGSGTARNRAIAESRGDFIAFLDADDVWLPGKLDAQLAVLASDPDLGGVYTAWHVWEPAADGRYVAPPEDSAGACEIDAHQSGWLYHHLLLDSVIFTSSLILRRRVVEAVGNFRPDLRRGQDYDYWLRLSRVTRVAKLARRFVLYRMHNASVATLHGDRNYELEIVEAALARYGAAGPDGSTVPAARLRARRAALHEGFAYRQFWRGNMRPARHGFWQAALLRPARVKNWLYAAAAAAISGIHRK